MQNILFIVNPVAGRGHGRRLAEFIVKNSGSSFKPVIMFTGGKGDAKMLTRRGLEQGILKFVAVGGDGTVNEVASELVNTEGVLGIIPTGSGNGLARHIKIPLRVRGALQIISGGKVRDIDYGLVEKQPFFCVSGVGFDASVGHRFAESPGRGLQTYARTAIMEFFRYKPKMYTLKIDGKRIIRRRAFLITFANASQYGNNAHIAPGADVGDGLIDLCILRPFHIIKSLGIVFELFGKSLDKNNLLEIIKCREVQLKRKHPGYIHYDGEPIKAGKKIIVRVVKHGLKVMVP